MTEASNDAEKVIAGAIVLHEDWFSFDSIKWLQPEDFSVSLYRAIYQAACELDTKGIEINRTTIKEPLGRMSIDLEGKSINGILLDLMYHTPAAADMQVYARTIVEERQRERIQTLAMGLLDKSKTLEELSVDIARLSAVSEEDTGGMQTANVTISDAIVKLFDDRYRERDNPNVISSTFDNLDDILGGGLHRGEITVIAGRPAAGKSSIGEVIATKISEAGDCVIYFSLEMEQNDIAARYVSGVTGTAVANYMGAMSDEQYELAEPAFGYSASSGLIVNTMRITDAKGHTHLPQRTPSNIAREVRRVAKKIQKEKPDEKFPIKAIVIDQLSHLHPDNTKVYGERETIAETVREVFALAQELFVPVILLCQINRGADENPKEPPQIRHLKGSGAIEEDAATVMLLHNETLVGVREPFKNGDDCLRVIVAKNRHGKIDSAYFAYNPSLNRYIPVPAEQQAEEPPTTQAV